MIGKERKRSEFQKVWRRRQWDAVSGCLLLPFPWNLLVTAVTANQDWRRFHGKESSPLEAIRGTARRLPSGWTLHPGFLAFSFFNFFSFIIITGKEVKEKKEKRNPSTSGILHPSIGLPGKKSYDIMILLPRNSPSSYTGCNWMILEDEDPEIFSHSSSSGSPVMAMDEERWVPACDSRSLSRLWQSLGSRMRELDEPVVLRLATRVHESYL